MSTRPAAPRRPAGARAVYLDWAATAPPWPGAVAAAREAWRRLESGEWANPASVHRPGRLARAALDDACRRIASRLEVEPERLRLTSGGTQALALALAGGAPVLASAVEHSAVAHAAPGLAIVPVGPDGLVSPQSVRAALEAGPAGARVAIQHASHETGVIQDLEPLAEVVTAAGASLIVDAVQSAGKLALPKRAAAVALSAHKLGGVAGTGVLVVDDPDRWPQPAGTVNLAGVLAFAAALDALAADADWIERALSLGRRLEAGVASVGGRVIAQASPRLPTLATVQRPGIPGEQQLMALDLAQVAVSIGPACTSATMRASPTLGAMGEAKAARESVRVSWGWTTTEADIDRFLEVWSAVGRGRRAA